MHINQSLFEVAQWSPVNYTRSHRILQILYKEQTLCILWEFETFHQHFGINYWTEQSFSSPITKIILTLPRAGFIFSINKAHWDSLSVSDSVQQQSKKTAGSLKWQIPRLAVSAVSTGQALELLGRMSSNLLLCPGCLWAVSWMVLSSHTPPRLSPPY